jgi:UDP-N-acetylmuramate dehydrogenase
MTLSNPMPPSLVTLKPSGLPLPSKPVLVTETMLVTDRPLEETAVKAAVQVSDDCAIKPQVSLARMTSFQVGGAAEWFTAPRNVEDLQRSLQWAHAEGLSVTMLGRGSNLLISDDGLPGLVIATKYLKQTVFDYKQGTVTVDAGVYLPPLARQIAELGWQGFEWAVGVPGSIGGAVVMNAGAHGGSVADTLLEAKVLLPDGTMQTMTQEELQFKYRTSNLQSGGRFVTQATFKLNTGADPVAVQEQMDYWYSQRKSSQPYDKPSCGSVFRNPEPQKAAQLIEQLGLKGFQIGGAQVAYRHANFILNCGGAKAMDIYNLIYHVQNEVESRWDLKLEPEVRMLGNFKAA